MSEAAGEVSERLHQLADVVDHLEDSTDLEVKDARLDGLSLDGGLLRAGLTVLAPIDPESEVLVEAVDRDDVQDDVVDNEPEDEGEDGEVWCAKCGFGPSSEAGVARHNGAVHGGDAEITTDADEVPDVVDEGEGEVKPTPEEVFAALLEMADDGHNWVKARQLADHFDVTGQLIGQRLRVLRDDDLVEKNRNRATVAVWRPVPTADQQETDDQDAVESDHSIEDDECLEAPDVDLQEPDADDAPEDTGDDVQGESDTVDEEKPTVDGVNYDQDIEIDLPDGITKSDIDELTSGGIELGDLAGDLDVHPNRARAIAFDLGYYSRVREVKYRGGL